MLPTVYKKVDGRDTRRRHQRTILKSYDLVSAGKPTVNGIGNNIIHMFILLRCGDFERVQFQVKQLLKQKLTTKRGQWFILSFFNKLLCYNLTKGIHMYYLLPKSVCQQI